MDINDQQTEGLRMMKFTARDANMEKQSELEVIIKTLTHESEFGQMAMNLVVICGTDCQ